MVYNKNSLDEGGGAQVQLEVGSAHIQQGVLAG